MHNRNCCKFARIGRQQVGQSELVYFEMRNMHYDLENQYNIAREVACVTYQPHEAAGERLIRSFRITLLEVASLRLNRGSYRKLRKRQNSISKQM